MITPRFDVPADYLAQQGLSATFPKRFWKNVFLTPTHWLWEGMRKERSCHGTIWRGVRNPRTGRWQWLIGAHVASWIIHCGPLPEGKQVLHCCPDGHVAWCVNPNHLKLGDQKQNSLDMVTNGTSYMLNNAGKFHGPNNGGSKFTYEQIDEIRAKYATGHYTQWHLAHEYGVTQSCIYLIVRHKNWRKIGADRLAARP